MRMMSKQKQVFLLFVFSSLFATVCTASGTSTWTGSGNFGDPYVYTYTDSAGVGFVVSRGQYEFDATIGPDPWNGIITHTYIGKQIDQFNRFGPDGMGGQVEWDFEGYYHTLNVVETEEPDSSGQPMRVATTVTQTEAVIVEFVNPLNPLSQVGVWESVLTDVDGNTNTELTEGSVTASATYTLANPNPNNDPPAEYLLCYFDYEQENDTWYFDILRQLDGAHDLCHNQTGDWSDYEYGEWIDIPDPSHSPTVYYGLKTDWLMSVYSAWQMYYFSINCPAPMQFDFDAFTHEFLHEYDPFYTA